MLLKSLIRHDVKLKASLKNDCFEQTFLEVIYSIV